MIQKTTRFPGLSRAAKNREWVEVQTLQHGYIPMIYRCPSLHHDTRIWFYDDAVARHNVFLLQEA